MLRSFGLSHRENAGRRHNRGAGDQRDDAKGKMSFLKIGL